MSRAQSQVSSPEIDAMSTKEFHKIKAKEYKESIQAMRDEICERVKVGFQLARDVGSQRKGMRLGFQDPDSDRMWPFPTAQLNIFRRETCDLIKSMSALAIAGVAKKPSKKTDPFLGTGNHQPVILTGGLMKFVQNGDFGPFDYRKPNGEKLIDKMPTLKSGFTSSNILRRLWYCYVRANRCCPGDQASYFVPNDFIRECFDNPDESVFWFHQVLDDHSNGSNTKRIPLSIAIDRGLEGAHEGYTGFDRLRGRTVKDPLWTGKRADKPDVPFSDKNMNNNDSQTLMPLYYVNATAIREFGLAESSDTWAGYLEDLTSEDTIFSVATEHGILDTCCTTWDEVQAEKAKKAKRDEKMRR